jgi:hypothetical protein
VVDAVLGIGSICSNLHRKVELVLLIRSHSIGIVSWVYDRVDAITEIVSSHHSSIRMESEQTNSSRSYFFVERNCLLDQLFGVVDVIKFIPSHQILHD